MSLTRRAFLTMASGMAACLTSCATDSQEEEVGESAPAEEETVEPEVDLDEFEALALDMRAWKHDEENDVYYQLGVPYCLHPVAETFGSLAIFVPGAYLTPKDENKKKPELVIREGGQVGEYTVDTAPIVMPINSGDFRRQVSPTTYSFAGLSNYLSKGCIYVYAGFRGSSSGYESGREGLYAGGAPWLVADLKAAVRFLRYNAHVLPGDYQRIFTFGFSGGGGVSAVLGASGDAELYLPYLEAVGAAMHDVEGTQLSDAIFGSASWCPSTSYDAADAAYEWMMGQYDQEATRAEGTWTKMLSDNLARAFARYVNELGLVDEQGVQLALDETSGDIYADGSYYLHLVECLERSATTFFASTQFPYTYTPQHLIRANFPGDPNLQNEATGESDIEKLMGDASARAAGVTASEDGMTSGLQLVESVVYATPSDYVADLNRDTSWLTYNQTRGTVRITSLGDFVRHLKVAAKGVCAFDALDRSTAVNQLFGLPEEGSLHFSQMVCDELSDGRDEYAGDVNWSGVYQHDWMGDLAEVDALGTDMATRMGMFNPLYFLCANYAGHGTATVAPHWRVNAGLFQTDTSMCTEVNLALALSTYEGVEDVAFTPVWGQGHVLAEVNGSAEENFLSWVNTCCLHSKKEK